MPRLTKSLPRYRLHKASGQAVVTLSGRDFYLGAHGSAESQSAYQRCIGEWLASHKTMAVPALMNDTASVPTAPQRTVNEVFLAYWPHAQAYYQKNGQPTSHLGVIRLAIRPLAARYGDIPAAEFGPRALKALREGFILEGLARGTINKYICIIKRMFRWAASEELVHVSVHQALQTVADLHKGRSAARETTGVRPVAPGGIEKVLALVSPQVAAMIRVEQLTAMRPGEVVLMRGCDLDRGSPVWVYRPAAHKNEHHDKDRVVFIGRKAQAILRPFLTREPSAYLFSPADAEKKRHADRRAQRRTPMTPSQARRSRNAGRKRPPGDRYTVASYRRVVQRACAMAFPCPKGLSPEHAAIWRREHRWSPNQLRHTAGTEIRKKFGLEASRVVLGHASTRPTEIYAERDSERAAAVIARVG